MKRYRFPLLVIAVAIGAVLAGSASAQAVRVVVNGGEVEFLDEQPVQLGGRVYIPLRGVLEQVGAETIEWRPVHREVFVANDNRQILLQIGNPEALVDGEPVPLDAPPILSGGRTLVPLRFLCESLNADVEWEDSTRTASISTAVARVAGRREVFPPPVDREFDDRLDERGTAPGIRPLRPLPGNRTASRRPEITAIIRESGAPAIDYDSIRMRVNGEDVTSNVEVGHNSVTYRPMLDLPRGRNAATITLRERGGALVRRDWSFWVE